jgi:hypothetical protein
MVVGLLMFFSIGKKTTYEKRDIVYYNDLLYQVQADIEAGLSETDIEDKYDCVLNNGNLLRMRHFKEYIEVPDAINRVYDSKNEFKALYEWVEERKLYRPVKVFISTKE